MKVITVINDQRNEGFNLLRLSCAANDLELVALLYGKRTFSSNRIKDELLANYLEEYVNYDEIIVFSDGNDAVFMTSAEEILGKFKRSQKDILFSAETSCWPDPGLADQYPDLHPGPYKFLNSGGFIGKAGAVLELLADTSIEDENFIKSNQYLWAKRYFKYPERIGLDSACEIFYTFSPELGEKYWDEENHLPYYGVMKEWFDENFTVDNKRLFSRMTDTWPCQAHFNGRSKILMDSDIIDMVFSKIPNSRPARFYVGKARNVVNYDK